VSGVGYGANEAITIRWNCSVEPESQCASPTVLGTPVTDASGSFHQLVTVPSDATAAPYELGGKGSTTKLYADADFAVRS
jgi:hypothetical protein